MSRQWPVALRRILIAQPFAGWLQDTWHAAVKCQRRYVSCARKYAMPAATNARSIKWIIASNAPRHAVGAPMNAAAWRVVRGVPLPAWVPVRPHIKRYPYHDALYAERNDMKKSPQVLRA